MKIRENIEIILCKSGEIILQNGISKAVFVEKSNPAQHKEIMALYKEMRAVSASDRLTKDIPQTVLDIIATALSATEGANNLPSMTKEEMLTKIINFFTEFQFEPNFRFINTLAHCDKPAIAKQYVHNYFALTDNAYSKEINEKIKSPEFAQLLDNMPTPTQHINKRFKIYYGSQGTGKTTLAMKETNSKCMVCNSSMLPADLMEDFVFVDGKATFQPSALWNAMTNGDKITLDEINLLPFDSLRFLQTILDGKQEFLYKGHTVTIADGFQIIGTMNLSVNGMVYSLPQPLVDRACALRCFQLTAKDLCSALD